MNTFKLSETLRGASDIKLIRDGSFCLIHKPNYATEPRTLTYLTLRKSIKKINKNLNISCVICTEDIASNLDSRFGICVCKNPKDLFFKLHLTLFQNLADPVASKIHNSCNISKFANISETNVIIGQNCIIEDGATIKPGVHIGNSSIVRSGAILGAEGFEVSVVDNKKILIPHLGDLVVGDNVEILSNSTICKALFWGSSTKIGDNVFIDCLVHVAHGCQIDFGTKIAASSVLSGNTTVGNNVWIGPNATISNGISIGDNAYIALGSVVIRDVNQKEQISGNFAYEHAKNMLDYFYKTKK